MKTDKYQEAQNAQYVEKGFTFRVGLDGKAEVDAGKVRKI